MLLVVFLDDGRTIKVVKCKLFPIYNLYLKGRSWFYLIILCPCLHFRFRVPSENFKVSDVKQCVGESLAKVCHVESYFLIVGI